MTLATLKMDKAVAADKYSAFRKSRRRDPETIAAMTAYQLLAEGRVLVDVGIAIREGGFDSQMRPRLALARADRKQVAFSWRSRSELATFNTAIDLRRPQMIEEVNMNRRHGQTIKYSDGRTWERDVTGYALVPMVPADISFGGYKPAECHILWEVEAWADKPILAVPPVDPYLLHRVGGDLFEVLAQWDLTEVERYVMAGRAKVGR
jgi:hypothetical protein